MTDPRIGATFRSMSPAKVTVLKTALVAALAAFLPSVPALLEGTLPDALAPMISAVVAAIALHLKPPAKETFQRPGDRSDERGYVRTETLFVTLALSAFAAPLLIGCAMLGGGKDLPKDPGAIARETRVASQKACAAYQASVAGGLVKADPRADAACAAVQGVCTDIRPLDLDLKPAE